MALVWEEQPNSFYVTMQGAICLTRENVTSLGYRKGLCMVAGPEKSNKSILLQWGKGPWGALEKHRHTRRPMARG